MVFQLRDTQRLVRIVTALALVALVPAVLYHLVIINEKTGNTQREVVRILWGTHLLESLAAMSKDDSLKENLVKQGVIVPQPVDATLFPASPTTSKVVACEDYRSYQGSLIANDCAAIFGGSPRFWSDIETEGPGSIEQYLAALKYLYDKQGAPVGKKTPRVLFVHSVVSVGSERLFMVYPATHIPASFDLADRPWIGSSEDDGGLKVSPLYRDYATGLSIITITLTNRNGVIVGVDLRVTPPTSAAGVYFINTLFCLAALLIYWRYYFSMRKRKFLFWLTLSMAILFLEYVILLGNAIWRPSSTSLDTYVLTAFLLPFLPSGALLARAAITLGPRSWDKKYLSFPALWLCEVMLGLLNILLSTPIPAAVFGFLCLTSFGVATLKIRRQYNDEAFREMSPHPISLSIGVFMAYIFWGGSQFGLALLRLSPMGWRWFSDLPSLGGLREVLLSDASVFTLLLYAKGVAIFLTILYLGAVDKAWWSISFLEDYLNKDSAPFLLVAQDGRIVGGGNLPLHLAELKGMRLWEFPDASEDSRNIEVAWGKDASSLTPYLCRLSGPFKGQLYSLSVASDLGESGARRVFLNRISRSQFIKRLDASLCREMKGFAEGLQAASLEIDWTNVSGGRPLQKLINRRAPLVVAKASDELRMLVYEDALVRPRMTISDAVRVLQDATSVLSNDERVWIRVETEGLEQLPDVLRISEGVFRVIIDELFGALLSEGSVTEGPERDASDGPIEGTLRFLAGPQDRVGGGEDFVTLELKTVASHRLLARWHEAEDRSGRSWSQSQEESTETLLESFFDLLRYFGAKAHVVDLGDGEVCFMVRFRHMEAGTLGNVRSE